MTALEAIQSNPDYSSFKGTLPLVLTSKYHPFIKDNELYCVGTFKEKGLEYGFFKVNRDGRILQGLPHSIDYQIQLKSILWELWGRIDNLFSALIIFSEQQGMLRVDTELVQLRIIVNMIYSLPIISKEDKSLWVDWVKELYWNRKSILNQWYIDNVLPF